MADKGQEKTLEMRVAELEDKLSKVHITEEEWKTFQKVASAMGGTAAGAPMPSSLPISCIIRTCIIRTCIIHCIIQCIFECSCGPCIQSGGGGAAGGGFGGLGA